MILTANPSRNSSRVALLSMFGLGTLLLVPNAARTEPPERSEQPTRASEIEKLQGEIELLKVQVQMKEARIHAAKLLYEEFRKRYQRDRRANWFPPPSEEELAREFVVEAERRLVVTTQKRELAVKEAELQEPLVRLKQAQRRLNSLERSSADEREQATRTRPRRSRERSLEDDERQRREQVVRLQDELELFRVQAKIREAHLQAEKELADDYQKQRDTMLRLNMTTPGSVPQEEIGNVVRQIKTHSAQLRIREAELQEPLVRIKQIERQLTRLQRPTPGSREPQEQRLKELEKKVDQILEEIKSLKRDCPQAPKGNSPGPARK